MADDAVPEDVSGPARRRQSTETVQKLLDGKLRLERRNGGSKLYARAFLDGKAIVKSTGVRIEKEAIKIATDWYLELRDRMRKGEALHGKTFAEMAEAFLKHADRVREVSEGQRRNYRQKWALLKPHFTEPRAIKVTDVDTSFLLELRETRSAAQTKQGVPIRPATLKKDLDFVRLVLKHAKYIEKVLDELPEWPSFRGSHWQVMPNPRPFLDHKQWTKVRNLAKKRSEEKGLNPRTQRQRLELYRFMLLCVGAALRVGEAYSLRWCDCELKLSEKGEEFVHLKVLGKHSRGGQREDAIALFGAISAYKAMKADRPDALPEDRLFAEVHREGFKDLLIAAGLRSNAAGMTRNAKSLRQTGITMRLERGDNLDYREISIWARTSPTMIAKFYDQTHPLDAVDRLMSLRGER